MLGATKTSYVIGVFKSLREEKNMIYLPFVNFKNPRFYIADLCKGLKIRFRLFCYC